MLELIGEIIAAATVVALPFILLFIAFGLEGIY